MTDSFIINYHWLQPSKASSSFVANLTEEEVINVKFAIEFINRHPDSGEEIPAFEVTRAYDGVVGGKDYQNTLIELAQEGRYWEELYEEKLHLFENLKRVIE